MKTSLAGGIICLSDSPRPGHQAIQRREDCVVLQDHTGTESVRSPFLLVEDERCVRDERSGSLCTLSSCDALSFSVGEDVVHAREPPECG